jgi:hypothetical protein
MRIQPSATRASTTTTTAGHSTPFVRSKQPEPHPLNVLLFGKQAPRRLDRRKHPKLRKALRKLEYVTEQLAEMVGQPSNALSIELCEGNNAFISRNGTLSVGKDLLEQHEQDDDLLVAVLGHEVGHQPWTWPRGDLSHLKKKDLDALYREEEAKADRFAGRVLADLGADPKAISDFLLRHQKFEGNTPSDYYPAEVRVQMIVDAYQKRLRALKRSRSIFPELVERSRELR